jgi:hypothetical protein
MLLVMARVIGIAMFFNPFIKFNGKVDSRFYVDKQHHGGGMEAFFK